MVANSIEAAFQVPSPYIICAKSFRFNSHSRSLQLRLGAHVRGGTTTLSASCVAQKVFVHAKGSSIKKNFGTCIFKNGLRVSS